VKVRCWDVTSEAKSQNVTVPLPASLETSALGICRHATRKATWITEALVESILGMWFPLSLHQAAASIHQLESPSSHPAYYPNGHCRGTQRLVLPDLPKLQNCDKN
jgi:hypothetical protein